MPSTDFSFSMMSLLQNEDLFFIIKVCEKFYHRGIWILSESAFTSEDKILSISQTIGRKSSRRDSEKTILQEAQEVWAILFEMPL